MDFSWLKVGPLGPIIAAIITFFATFFFLRKRKRVIFLVSKSEDLTLPLRRESRDVTFKITGEDWFNLNRATVTVKNIGNTSIKDLQFDIQIPGSHNHYRAGIARASNGIRPAIKINWDDPPVWTNPLFHISLPFFNRIESFELFLFFEGTTDECNVRCRMGGVEVKIKEAPRRTLFQFLRGRAT
jgi:hypothetical protein